MQHLTMQDIAHIIGLYRQTHSRKQVARELGLSEYRVRRILIDNGILSDYDAAIAAAIAAGDSLEDAARKFGVTPDSENAKRIRKCRAKKKASAEADAFPLKP